MKPRPVALGLVAALGVLWATWPGAAHAWLCVVLLAPLAWSAWRGKRVHALVALGAAALSTSLLPAGAFDWRAWLTAGLVAALAATLLAPGGLPVRAPRPTLLLAASLLALLLALLRTWTPTRGILLDEDGATAANAILLAVGLVLVIVLTASGDDEGASAAEP